MGFIIISFIIISICVVVVIGKVIINYMSGSATPGFGEGLSGSRVPPVFPGDDDKEPFEKLRKMKKDLEEARVRSEEAQKYAKEHNIDLDGVHYAYTAFIVFVAVCKITTFILKTYFGEY
jgi:hypothetical protein